MGAWGYGSFENDSALDFLSSLINEKAIKKQLKNYLKLSLNIIIMMKFVLLHRS